MRKKTVQVLLGAALIAAMCLGAPTAAFAGETTTKEETAEKTGDKDSTEEKETVEDFQIGELTVKNQSGLEVKSAGLQDAKEDDSKKKDSKDAAGQDLVITMKDGTEHTLSLIHIYGARKTGWYTVKSGNTYKTMQFASNGKYTGKSKKANAELIKMTDSVLRSQKISASLTTTAQKKTALQKLFNYSKKYGYMRMKGFDRCV